MTETPSPRVLCAGQKLILKATSLAIFSTISARPVRSKHYEQTKHLTARGLAEFAAKLRADTETAWKEQTATRDAKRVEGETAAETNFRDLGARNPQLLHSCAIGSI